MTYNERRIVLWDWNDPNGKGKIRAIKAIRAIGKAVQSPISLREAKGIVDRFEIGSQSPIELFCEPSYRPCLEILLKDAGFSVDRPACLVVGLNYYSDKV